MDSSAKSCREWASFYGDIESMTRQVLQSAAGQSIYKDSKSKNGFRWNTLIGLLLADGMLRFQLLWLDAKAIINARYCSCILIFQIDDVTRTMNRKGKAENGVERNKVFKCTQLEVPSECALIAIPYYVGVNQECRTWADSWPCCRRATYAEFQNRPAGTKSCFSRWISQGEVLK